MRFKLGILALVFAVVTTSGAWAAQTIVGTTAAPTPNTIATRDNAGALSATSFISTGGSVSTFSHISGVIDITGAVNSDLTITSDASKNLLLNGVSVSGATGATTFPSSLSAGATNLSTLTVAGALSAGATNLSSLGVTGNTTLTGTLSAGPTTLTTLNAGVTVLASTLSVNGLTTATGGITSPGDIVTTGAGKITSNGLLTGSAGLSVTGTSNIGALNAGNTAITGTLSTSLLATLASASVTGNLTAGGITNSPISGAAGAFTTLTSSGNSTIATDPGTTNSFGTGLAAVNTFGEVTGTNAIKGNTALTGTLSVSGVTTATGGITSPSNITTTGLGTITSANGLTVTAGGLTVTAGGANITGGINNHGGLISNVLDPVNPQDAATKGYVDSKVDPVTDGTTLITNVLLGVPTFSLNLAHSNSWSALQTFSTLNSTGNTNIGTGANSTNTIGNVVGSTNTINGATTLTSSLGVNGATTLSSTVAVAGPISGTGDLIVQSNQGAASNLTLKANGAGNILLSSPVNAGANNITTTGALSAGASTLASATVTGAATVGTTLGVTGISTLGVLNSGASTLDTLAVGAGGTAAAVKQIITQTSPVNFVATELSFTSDSAPITVTGAALGATVVVEPDANFAAAPQAGTPDTKTVTNAQVASNVVTLTTSAAHGFTTGDSVAVLLTGGDAIYNGTFTITAAAGTTFSYSLTTGNIAIHPATGTAYDNTSSNYVAGSGGGKGLTYNAFVSGVAGGFVTIRMYNGSGQSPSTSITGASFRITVINH